MSAASAPKISVLLPVYNTKEEYLRECIESILGQTFRDFELLVVNDGSTDSNVEKAVKSYSDKRIRYFANESNLGISPTRNRLVDLARGEFLAVMDHDDVLLPECFAKEAAFLDANPDCGAVGCWRKVSGAGEVQRTPESDHRIKLALIHGSCAVWHPGSMIRKSVLLESGARYEEEFTPSEDYALWCRLIGFTKFHNLPEVLLEYRRHETNTSKLQSRKMNDAAPAIQAFARAENPALYAEFLALAERKAYWRLFGIVPLATVVSRGAKGKVLLFGFIPLLAWKKTAKMK